MNKLQSFLFIFVFLLLGCNEHKTNSFHKVHVHIKKEIILDDKAAEQVHTIYPVASSTIDGNFIALSNYKSPVGVILVDFEGKFIKKIASEGRGPAEIQSAWYMGFDEESNFYVQDRALGLIKKFDIESNDVQSFELLLNKGINITSKNFEYCNDRWYLAINKFKNSPTDTTSIIGVFDGEFNLVNTFGGFDPFFKGNKSLFESPIITVDCKNEKIYATHWKVPFIQIFDLNDLSLTFRTETIPPSFRLSEEFMSMVYDQERYRDFTINEQSMSTLITQNKDYVILSFRNGSREFYKNKDLKKRPHYLAVFSKVDYSFLGEIPVEGVPMGTTNEGHIIALINDEAEDFKLHLLDVTVVSE